MATPVSKCTLVKSRVLGHKIPNWKSLKNCVIASLVVSPKCNNAKNTMKVSSWLKHGCSPCRPRLPRLTKPIFLPSANRGARGEAEDDRDWAAQHGTDWRLDGSQAHLDQKVEKESQRADRYLNPRPRPSMESSGSVKPFYSSAFLCPWL